ncbi:MAG: HAD family hydrolase [Candidatus Paceibacterota bacterium]|jgi:phosphoglycolate phosphatase-like HAD superfamily hydrolase
MDKKIIIFDMDGVLFDTIPNAKKAFLDRHTGVTSEMYDEIHTGNYHVEAGKYSHLRREETEEEKEIREAAYAEMKQKTPLFEGMASLLKDLHNAGYTLVLNTNAFNKFCLPLLEQAGIKELFDFVATAELSKDKIEKFKLIEDKYGAEKKDLLFVTNALGDVRDAEVAEVPTVAVTWGVHNKAFFEREKHPYLVGIIDTTSGLLNFIRSY